MVTKIRPPIKPKALEEILELLPRPASITLTLSSVKDGVAELENYLGKPVYGCYNTQGYYEFKNLSKGKVVALHAKAKNINIFGIDGARFHIKPHPETEANPHIEIFYRSSMPLNLNKLIKICEKYKLAYQIKGH